MSVGSVITAPGRCYLSLTTMPFPIFRDQLPDSASLLGQGVEGEEEDIVTLLEDKEVTEFCKFNLTVHDNSTWDTGEAINQYLEGILLER